MEIIKNLLPCTIGGFVSLLIFKMAEFFSRKPTLMISELMASLSIGKWQYYFIEKKSRKRLTDAFVIDVIIDNTVVAIPVPKKVHGKDYTLIIQRIR